MGRFDKYRFNVDGDTIVTEKKERAWVFFPSLNKSLMRTIYTTGPDDYIIVKGKLTKVINDEKPIVRYRLEN